MGLWIPFYHSLTCKKPWSKQGWMLGQKVKVVCTGVVAGMGRNGEIQISMEENGQNFLMHVETWEMEILGIGWLLWTRGSHELTSGCVSLCISSRSHSHPQTFWRPLPVKPDSKVHMHQRVTNKCPGVWGPPSEIPHKPYPQVWPRTKGWNYSETL